MLKKLKFRIELHTCYKSICRWCNDFNSKKVGLYQANLWAPATLVSTPQLCNSLPHINLVILGLPIPIKKSTHRAFLTHISLRMPE